MNLLEIRAAGRQHHLVTLEGLSLISGEGHIHKALSLKQVVKYRGQVGLVVVPPQAILLVVHLCGGEVSSTPFHSPTSSFFGGGGRSVCSRSGRGF